MVTGGGAVGGVPAARVMRPAGVDGSLPTPTRELHVAPASVETQTSPAFPLAQPAPDESAKNPSGGRAVPSQAGMPLAAQRLTPPTCPVYASVQTFSRRAAPLGLGRSTSE